MIISNGFISSVTWYRDCLLNMHACYICSYWQEFIIRNIKILTGTV